MHRACLQRRTASRHAVRGVVMVETTIVLPVLLLLLFATAEIGRIFYNYNTVTKTARESARYLSNHAFSGDVQIVDLTAERILAAQNYAVYGNAAGGETPLLEGLAIDQVAVSSSAASITIAIDYDHTPIFGPILQTFGFGEGVNVDFPLRTAVTMRAIN